MKNQRVGWLATAAASVVMACIGCDDTARGAKQDAKENTAAAKEAARDAKQEGAAATERATDKVQDEAQRAADKVEDGARKAGAEIDAAKQTLDVKTALMADKSVDASHIDVDTSDQTKTVTLKGSVPTADQKAAAERIAQAKAAGYTIKNELQVAK